MFFSGGTNSTDGMNHNSQVIKNQGTESGCSETKHGSV